jgi:hypothetical protein
MMSAAKLVHAVMRHATQSTVNTMVATTNNPTTDTRHKTNMSTQACVQNHTPAAAATKQVQHRSSQTTRMPA